MKEDFALSSTTINLPYIFIKVKENKNGITVFDSTQYKKPKSKSKNTDWKQRIDNFKKM